MDIKDNTKNFDVQATNFDDDYLGLLHIDEFYPIPIKGYPEGSYFRIIFIAGKYVGTSFRKQAMFLSYDELMEYLSGHRDLIYLFYKITIGRI